MVGRALHLIIIFALSCSLLHWSSAAATVWCCDFAPFLLLAELCVYSHVYVFVRVRI